MNKTMKVILLICFLIGIFATFTDSGMIVKSRIPIKINNPKQYSNRNQITNKASESLPEIDPDLDSDIPTNIIKQNFTSDEDVTQYTTTPTVYVEQIEAHVDQEQEQDQETVNHNDTAAINRFCSCSKTSCNCCREIKLPIPFLPVNGPGCATVKYAGNEKVYLTIKYGDIVLASRTISGKNAPPICLPLPGGYSKFCGRVYGLAKGADDFRACLGLELKDDDSTEAAVRVSCFKFGSTGLAVAEAEPIPSFEKNEEDDDDDFLGFGGGSDDDDDDADDDDDDYDYGTGGGTGTESDNSPDYEGFSIFGSNIFGNIFGTRN